MFSKITEGEIARFPPLGCEPDKTCKHFVCLRFSGWGFRL